MHLSRTEIERYCENLPTGTPAGQIAEHLKVCEFCREIYEEYRSFQRAVDAAGRKPDAEVALVVSRLRERFDANVIRLEPFGLESEPSELYLAADAPDPAPRGSECLANLKSDEPELVLRVMRNHDRHRDFVQLVADDPATVAHILVQIPDLNCEFMTDASGRADLPEGERDDYRAMKWQVRFPEAVFDLQPLLSAPRDSSSSDEVTLTTEQGDEIVVVLESASAGQTLSVTVKSVRGVTDFDKLRAYVTTAHESARARLAPDKPVYVGPVDSRSTLKISLFR